MALRPTRSLSLLPLLTRRTLTTTTTRLLQPFPPPRDETYAKQETSRPLNPHLTNTTSTLRPDSGIPSVGVHNAPPHLISAVDSSFNPKDTRDPKITQILTGGTQDGLGTPSPSSGSKKKKGKGAREHNTTAATYHTDKEVLTHLHSTFQIPPLPRTGEDLPTLRSRLQYQSRKRGILETDLLLSTFADENLHKLSREQLDQYDKFLDENDWDIYYWCTQVQPSTSLEYAEGGSREYATETVSGKDIPSPSSPSSSTTNATFSTLKNTAAANSPPHTDTTSPSSSENTTLVDYVTSDAPHPSAPKMKVEVPPTAFAAGMDTSGAGEWAQTVGRKKEPYRQPPERWVHSEILGLIRRHVEEKKAKKGIKGEEGIGAGVGKGSVKSGLGLGQMPPVRNFEGVKGGSVLE